MNNTLKTAVIIACLMVTFVSFIVAGWAAYYDNNSIIICSIFSFCFVFLITARISNSNFFK